METHTSSIVLDRTMLHIGQTLVCTQRPTLCQALVPEKIISMSGAPFLTWCLIWLQQTWDPLSPGPAVHLGLPSKCPAVPAQGLTCFSGEARPAVHCTVLMACLLPGTEDPVQVLLWMFLKADRTMCQLMGQSLVGHGYVRTMITDFPLIYSLPQTVGLM